MKTFLSVFSNELNYIDVNLTKSFASITENRFFLSFGLPKPSEIYSKVDYMAERPFDQSAAQSYGRVAVQLFQLRPSHMIKFKNF